MKTTMPFPRYVMLLVMLLPACADYFKPYIPLEVEPKLTTDEIDEAKNKTSLINTQKSVKGLEKTVEQVTYRLNGRTITNRALNLTTYALTLGLAGGLATGASLTSSSSQVLALSAAAAYGANTLFFPATVEGAYLGANVALVCLATRGTHLVAAYEQAQKYYDEHNGVCEDIKEITELKAQLQNTLDGVSLNDGVFAAKLLDARNQVINALNLQLLSANPNPQAVLQAAQSGLAVVMGFATTMTASKTLTQSNNALKPRSYRRSSCLSTQKQQTVKNALITLNNNLSEQINLAGVSDTSCLSANTVVQPLTVLNQHVILSKTESMQIAISGGKPPFSVQWQDKALPAEVLRITLDQSARLLRLEVLTPPEKAVEGELWLIDGNVVPQRVALKVSVNP